MVTTVFTRLHSSQLPQKVAGTENTIFLSPVSLSPETQWALKEQCEMDNSHFSSFSAVSVSAVATATAAAAPPSSHTKKSIRLGPGGSICKQACRHTHTHTLPTPFSTPKKWQGI